MFRASSAHLQEDIVVYKQHMVPSLSIRVLVACRYAARVRTDCGGGRLLVGVLRQRPWIHISARWPAILTEGLLGLSHFLQENTGIVHQIKSNHFLSYPFQYAIYQ